MRIKNWQDLAHLGPHARVQLASSVSRGTSKRQRPEQDAGRCLVEWIDLLALPDGTRPGEYFAHVPNGGARSKVEGAILKGQGVRAGWPDYILDLPCGPYHGARLELKAPNGSKPDSEQLEILARLEAVGYYVAVAWGFDEARECLTRYLRYRWLNFEA